MKQPEALQLAEMIERYNAGVMSQRIVEDYQHAADELRRLEKLEREGLRTEIKEVESVEPVAWTLNEELAFLDKTERCSATMFSFTESDQEFIPLYPAPPATQQAKPLTTEQWGAIALEAGVDENTDDPVLIEKLVRAIEAAHGIKEQP